MRGIKTRARLRKKKNLDMKSKSIKFFFLGGVAHVRFEGTVDL